MVKNHIYPRKYIKDRLVSNKENLSLDKDGNESSIQYYGFITKRKKTLHGRNE